MDIAAPIGVQNRSPKSYHRVVPPCEDGEAVLVLIELLLYVRTHAFELTLQRDQDRLLT